MVGGLLVGGAALLAWWAAAAAGRVDPPEYLVARRTVAPGSRIEAADLGVLAVELPGPLRRQAFTRPDDVVGRISLGPLGPGSLIQADAIAPAPHDRVGRELSFAVDASWAVDGTLRPGDRIDVFSTADDAERTTRLVIRSAVVRRVGATGGSSSLGGTDAQTLTIGVRGPDRIAQLVAAVRAGKVTVARSTGALDDDAAPTPPRPTTTTSTTTTTAVRRSRPTTTTTTTTSTVFGVIPP